jgi:hypothetical protein
MAMSNTLAPHNLDLVEAEKQRQAASFAAGARVAQPSLRLAACIIAEILLILESESQ